MEQIEKREPSDKRLSKQIEAEAQRLKHERYAVDSFEEEQHRLSQLMDATTREARLTLRALFHRIIERIDIFTAGLLDEVPEHLKEAVYPERVGTPCYRVSLIGSYRIWIWWDGTQLWEDPKKHAAALLPN
jgi:hypothetical protein